LGIVVAAAGADELIRTRGLRGFLRYSFRYLIPNSRYPRDPRSNSSVKIGVNLWLK